MLLVMDVGNSNTVLGVYDADALVAHWRVATDGYRTADEWRVMLALLFQQDGLDMRAVAGCCVSSVVPQVNMALEQVAKAAFGVDALMVGPGVKTGLVLRVDNPREVGADRIVNAVAAIEEHEGSLILIDFGTATTFDAVSGKAEYLGGVIVPGVQVSADALFERCAKLPRVGIAKPAHAIGRNTVDNIRSGLTYGYADLIDGIVTRMTAEMDSAPTVIATGGLAPVIAEISRTIKHVDPWLTLKGLRAIYRRNAKGTT